MQLIDNYRANPVQNIQQLTNFRDPDKVINNFLTKFRNEFMATLPENLDSSVDKTNVIKNIRSVYLAKGTAKANEVFLKCYLMKNLKQFILKKKCLEYQTESLIVKKY